MTQGTSRTPLEANEEVTALIATLQAALLNALPAHIALLDIRSVLGGQAKSFSIEYACGTPAA